MLATITLITKSVYSFSTVGFGLAVLKQMLLTVFVASLPIQLSTNDSKQVQGELLEISDTGVTITLPSGQDQAFANDQIASITFDAAEQKVGPVTTLGMTDGSKIAIQGFAFDGKTFNAEPRRQLPLSLPASKLQWLRFYASSPKTDPAWLGMLDQSRRNDALAIRRDEGKLDQINGLVESISADRVGFNLDGSSIEAPVKRLEGIVFANKGTSNTSITVSDVYGSTWNAQSVVLPKGSQQLELKLSESITHKIPADQVVSIQWSSGVTFLASEEPIASEFASYVSIPNIDYAARASKWFGPEASNDSTIALHATSSVTYRIDPEMKRLAGSFSRATDRKTGGQVLVKILIDDQMTWEQALADDQSKGFDIPVAGGRRLTIKVLAGDDGDLGDVVSLNRARLTK